MKKIFVDFSATILLISAFITGFILHRDVHHLYFYDDTALWTLHEAVGLLLVVSLIFHSLQHSFWFSHYRRLKVRKRRVTTIMLCDGILVALSGLILMCGSQSNFISIFHYVTGILFTLLAIGHFAKRWKIFRALFHSSRG